jgi:hypothetical protein
MKMPWQNRTGLAKAAAVLASALVVSLGLCGMNFAAVTGLRPPNVFRPFLMIAAWIELLAIVLSLAGLVFVGFFAIIYAIQKRFSDGADRDGEE